MNLTKNPQKQLCTFITFINKTVCPHMAEKCNTFSHVVNISVLLLCIVVHFFTLICFLHAIVLTNVTRNKDIQYVHWFK